MTQVIISIIINSLVALSILANDSFSSNTASIFCAVMFGFVALSIIGTTGYKLTKNGWFLAPAFIGFAAFVPIGLIGVHGMKKVIAVESPVQ